jgi:drug/metabolite transporter (DMT)-like permease
MSASAIAIACGLGAALCFGTGDYLAQRLTRQHGWLAAVFAVQVAAAIVLGSVALAWHGIPSGLSVASVVGVVGVGLVNMLGLVGLYRAFERGKLSLVSPIAGSMGAFSVGFAALAGTPPPLLVVPGVVAVVVGIVCGSVIVEPRVEQAEQRDQARVRPARGVGWALLSALSFGWVFFVLGPTSEVLGPAWAVFALRVVAIAALLIPSLFVARPLLVRGLSELRAQSTGRLLLVVMLDAGGMLGFAYGSSRGIAAAELAVVAVLTSSFPLVTVALARIHLRERLNWWQWLGIAAVVAGIGWISAWSPSS